MSNVIDFPADPPPEDPEFTGKLLPGILEQEIIGAFKTGAPGTRDSRLRLLSPKEFREAFRRRDWLIEEVMERSALGQVFGASQTLKSFLAIDMGLCIATGTPWHGHNVRQGAVVYVCGEGRGGLSRRLDAWELRSGVEIDPAPFFITSRPALIYDKDGADQLSTALYYKAQAHGQAPELVIVDTVARNFGGDENSTQDMNQFILHLDTYLRGTFGCTVLLVHHIGHSKDSRGRGSSALHAALDFEFWTKREGDLLRVQCTKAKDDAISKPWYFEPLLVPLPWAETNGQAATSIVLNLTTRKPSPASTARLGARQLDFLRWLQEVAPDCIPYQLDTFKALCKERGMAKKTIDDCSRRLADYMLITCSEDENIISIAAGGVQKLVFGG